MSFFIRFARQWIAGETLDDAVISPKKANNRSIGAIINFLGEHVRDKDKADKNKIENLEILRTIKDAKLNSSLSIKLTQLGLGIDKNLYLSYVETIVSAANDIFVWVDMENSPYTE